MKPSLRTVALLVVAAVGIVVAIWSFSVARTKEPRLRIVPLDSTDGQELTQAAGTKPNPEHGPEVSARSRAAAGDEVDPMTVLPPAQGRTYWVRPGSGGGDGRADSPWIGLQGRLESLEPGDRLVLASGRYLGPLVLPANPGREAIEIVGRPGIVLHNDDQANAPVVRMEGHWALTGMEIHPGPTSIGIEITGIGATIRQVHIRKGGRDGIVIRSNARRVTVLRSHIHHVGGADGSGIFVERGAQDVRLDENKIHGVSGPKIVIFAPGEFERRAQGRQGSRRLELADSRIFVLESPWEP